ncbi:hypothetical protein PAXRUDRAFT_161509 [Paxillus rubicundulus Ve08.2h10]|uniref:Uncharacterized protein n=1 Tax=Paxillus rubicundulus Ve08.2h10 TaxID=930991 RepID=A0A0D0C8V7_9AGAM|nr:hypothetical protein PAXRUDRAFT_161509 [Paxillus rubicundulus Ve08.2h10]
MAHLCPILCFYPPPSPLTPSDISELVDNSDTSNSDSSTSSIDSDSAVHLLLQGIAAYADEIIATQVLNQPLVPVMRASQLILLDHFVDHRPGLFRKKLWVDPDIFDAILDQISDHPIFSSASHNCQLPIAIQLAIFLNRAGHYGNAISPKDVAQWAGVRVLGLWSIALIM